MNAEKAMHKAFKALIHVWNGEPRNEKLLEEAILALEYALNNKSSAPLTEVSKAQMVHAKALVDASLLAPKPGQLKDRGVEDGS